MHDLNDILSGRTAAPPPPPPDGGPFRVMQSAVVCSGCQARVPEDTAAMTANGLRCANCRRIANEAVAAARYDDQISYYDEAAARERRNYWIMRGIVLFFVTLGLIAFKFAMHQQQERDLMQLENRGLLDDSLR